MIAMVDIQVVVTRLRALWDEASTIWEAGGWAMVAIAATGLVMFVLGMHVLAGLWRKGFRSLSQQKLWRWIEEPAEREGPIGALLDAVADGDVPSKVEASFREVRSAEVAPFKRDLWVMKICVGVAPLLGLLGTVVGMLATFSALSAGQSGDKTMGEIAERLSTALVTTETGLVVALAGLFMQHLLSRMHDRYEAFLATVEAACTQAAYRRHHSANDPATNGRVLGGRPATESVAAGGLPHSAGE